jgi:hypothetical protein
MTKAYRIIIRGKLPADIHQRFSRVKVVDDEDGNCCITSSFADSSGLFGLMSWLNDLNAEFVSVAALEDASAADGSGGAHIPDG